MGAQSPQDDELIRPATPRERAFVEEYLRTWSAVKAATACGWKHPQKQAWYIFNRPSVQACLREQLTERSMSADEVLARLTAQARADIADVVRITKGRINVQDLRELQALGLSQNIKSISETRHRIAVEMYDAQAALIALGRAHGLFVDKVDNTGTQLVRVYVRDANDGD